MGEERSRLGRTVVRSGGTGSGRGLARRSSHQGQFHNPIQLAGLPRRSQYQELSHNPTELVGACDVLKPQNPMKDSSHADTSLVRVESRHLLLERPIAAIGVETISVDDECEGDPRQNEDERAGLTQGDECGEDE